jgi:hypothetical protein
MELRSLVFLALSLFTFSAHAQFGFFDQMFGGGGGGHQHQQQQQQNVRSDSQWYQSQYENGMLAVYFFPQLSLFISITTTHISTTKSYTE